MNRRSNVMTSSMPVNRTWRSVIRLTLCSRSSGSSPVCGNSSKLIVINVRYRSVIIARVS